MDVGRLILLTITTTSLLAGQSPISMRPIEFYEATLLLFFKSGSAMHASCKTYTVSAAVYVALCSCAAVQLFNGAYERTVACRVHRIKFLNHFTVALLSFENKSK